MVSANRSCQPGAIRERLGSVSYTHLQPSGDAEIVRTVARFEMRGKHDQQLWGIVAHRPFRRHPNRLPEPVSQIDLGGNWVLSELESADRRRLSHSASLRPSVDRLAEFLSISATGH